MSVGEAREKRDLRQECVLIIGVHVMAVFASVSADTGVNANTSTSDDKHIAWRQEYRESFDSRRLGYCRCDMEFSKRDIWHGDLHLVIRSRRRPRPQTLV
jgi:hypothetical protein